MGGGAGTHARPFAVAPRGQPQETRLRPQTIRTLDGGLGKPICLLLTAVRRCAQFVTGRHHPIAGPPRSILFLKMTEQGATVLAWSAIRRAIELVGRENVYFWVFDENRPILDLMDVLPAENVITVRADKLSTFLRDAIDTVRRVRRLRVDATVDMELFARAPAILAFLTGARLRVGLHRFNNEGNYRGDLLTHRVAHNPYLHITPAYYELVEALLEDPRQTPLLKRALPAFDRSPPTYTPKADESAAMREKLGRLAGRSVDGPVVLLNPNASDMLPLRKWEIGRFQDVGRRVLVDHPTATVVITGGPDERAAADALARKINPGDDSDGRRAFSVAGHTTLRELLVLYTIADVLVTNDSGPGHFASMTDVATLVLFGPETPQRYGPLGEHAHAVWAGLACSPCVNALNHRASPCDDNVCMKSITAEQVYEQVDTLLRSRNGRVTNLRVLRSGA